VSAVSPADPAADRLLLISVVIPVYNSEETIPPAWAALRATVAQLSEGYAWEVIFVDDGSRDASYARLVEIFSALPDRVRVVKLTRSFGRVPAILAGFRVARGDCCIVMSSDLQDPPALMLEMVQRWQRGAHKIVLATRSDREDGAWARWASRTFYRLMRRFAIPNMPASGFEVFLVDRRVVELIRRFEETSTFIQGNVLWAGFVPEVIGYTRPLGRSGRTRSQRVADFIDGFVSYTVAPVRLITIVGLVVSALSFAWATLIFVARLFWLIPVQGWAPTMIAILMLAGVQLVMLGIIGEYLWRNLYETRRRPNFVVESMLGGLADDEV